MNKIAISSDSTLDLSKELLEKYHIHVMPLHVLLGDKEYKDGIDFELDEFYKSFSQNLQISMIVFPLLYN